MHEKSFSSADKQARIMVILASGISDTNGLTKLIRYKAYVKKWETRICLTQIREQYFQLLMVVFIIFQ